MKKIALSIVTLLLLSCTKFEDDKLYQHIAVSVDLGKVPYLNLSEYHFFDGALKAQKPVESVIPFKPASSLFSDYTIKKRFVWLPKNAQARYNGADKAFEFPVGAVLIKTFYYNNIQPDNTTKILETRLMIKESSGWKMYNYLWNESQTEAILDTNQQGAFVSLVWKEKEVEKSIVYKIPSQTECITCHTLNTNNLGKAIVPIGFKPQNLNTNYIYADGAKNQLIKLQSIGFLGSDVPNNILSTVDWEDTSKSLDLRARSYIDINCAHCHSEGGHCDYAPQRFNFSNTNLKTFGVCLTPSNVQNGNFIINGGNATFSAMIIRMNSNVGAVKMPLIGRNIIHQEGVQLMTDWINSLPQNCR